VGGDIVAGNKVENYFNLAGAGPVEELARLYKKLEFDDDPAALGFCEKLTHYMSAPTNASVIGLEEKLRESDRLDLLQFATMLKEDAAKAIMRRQTSMTAQRIYTIVLDELHTNFVLTVGAAIAGNAERAEVDAQTKRAVFATQGILGENVLQITAKDLLGFLFFLTGNCHIRWVRC
jgi:hypothetical protein